MRKINLVFVLALVSACNKNADVRPTLAPSPEFKKVESVQNEFVFKGEAEPVIKALNEAGIQVQVEPVSQRPGNDKFRAHYEGSADFKTIERRLQNLVKWIEPNYKIDLTASKNRREWPNNRLFFKQWGFNNIGQSPPFGIPGAEGADMDILKAWTLTKGSRDIVVAVIDEGVDYTHISLKDRMWVNDKEAPANGGIAGVDDDKNGYVDDVYGYDFYTGGRRKLYYGVPGDPDPMDEGGHGTFCAGEIAAVPNNNIGVAGVNWNVRIMAVRFLGEGGGTSVDGARAIEYARINKADIMSNSWGGSSESKLIQEEIAEAAKAGILFVVAAGNSGKDIDMEKDYPAAYKFDKNHKPLGNVLTVGASDNQDNPADFSNFGAQTVDVFAPGVEIVSTFPKALLEEGAEPFSIMSGTSMATPYVAGVAALMLAHDSSYRGKPERVIETIQKTADVKASLIGKAISNGRINAYKALANIGQNPTFTSNWVTSGKTINQKSFQSELVDIRHTVAIPNAAAIRLHFNFIQTESPFDSIYIYDKDFRLITEIAESDSADYWSPIVPGDTVHIRFVNSLVRQVSMGLMSDPANEYTCATAGATTINIDPDGKVSCKVDKASSDDDDSKAYSTFNSRGFSIDQINFIAANAGGEK